MPGGVLMKIIALIPARGGSKRLPGKNIKLLDHHPLIAYTIQAAKDSGIFKEIYCSSESEAIGKIAEYYGAKWIKRPEEYSQDLSPDIDWINHALCEIDNCVVIEREGQFYIRGRNLSAFAILRPTSPFRTGETIKRAFLEWDKHHCMKAIEPVKQHPHKMWRINGIMMPYADAHKAKHLLPTQLLENVYIQNASLEIRQIKIKNGNDAFYQPFFTKDLEGYDINDEKDWVYAEWLIENDKVKLPEINIHRWF